MDTVKKPIGTEYRKTAQIGTGGSVAEAVLGAAAVVLAILGLIYGFPFVMASIAAIAVGAAMLFQGGAVASRYSQLSGYAAPSQVEVAELGSGLTGEMVGGIGGIVLGILALFGIFPAIMLPIAVIVMGGAMIMASGINDRLNAWSFRAAAGHTPPPYTSQAVLATTGLQILVGLGAVVLGILALTGMLPLVMSLVALLALGASELLSGSALDTRLAPISSR